MRSQSGTYAVRAATVKTKPLNPGEFSGVNRWRLRTLRQPRSEVDAKRDLAGAVAAEVRSSSRVDHAKIPAGDIQSRIGQIRVIEDVRKRNLRLETNALRQHQGFGQARAQIDGAWALDDTHAGIAETPNGCLRRSRVCADVAGAARCPSDLTRANEGSDVDPIVASLIGRDWISHAIRMLSATVE